MKIVTRIILAITAVMGMALALPVTAIELIIDTINGVWNGRVNFDRTAGMWMAIRDYAEQLYDDEN